MLYGENMKTLCLLNHKLTLNQIADLEQNWHSKEIVYPPEEIALMWSNIPPENLRSDAVQKLALWLKANSTAGDLFIIQGEFGSTFRLVDFALKNNLVPIYATTKRIARESCNGEKVQREYIFEHVCFKRYEYY